MLWVFLFVCLSFYPNAVLLILGKIQTLQGACHVVGTLNNGSALL